MKSCTSFKCVQATTDTLVREERLLGPNFFRLECEINRSVKYSKVPIAIYQGNTWDVNNIEMIQAETHSATVHSCSQSLKALILSGDGIRCKKCLLSAFCKYDSALPSSIDASSWPISSRFLWVSKMHCSQIAGAWNSSFASSTDLVPQTGNSLGTSSVKEQIRQFFRSLFPSLSSKKQRRNSNSSGVGASKMCTATCPLMTSIAPVTRLDDDQRLVNCWWNSVTSSTETPSWISPVNLMLWNWRGNQRVAPRTRWTTEYYHTRVGKSSFLCWPHTRQSPNQADSSC